MSTTLQNLLVLLAVAGCVIFLARGAYLALHGRKSSVGGCGTCGGCATAAPTQKPAEQRLAMVPMEDVLRTRRRKV